MATKIPLRGKRGIGLFAVVDDADAEHVLRHRWYLGLQGYPVANIRSEGGISRSVTMHVFLIPTEPGLETDHRDGYRLNNQRENLRRATHSQNLANCGVRRHNKSGFKGVRWHSHNRMWHARITVGGHCVHLGYFRSPEEAHGAYLAAAKDAFGEFARGR